MGQFLEKNNVAKVIKEEVKCLKIFYNCCGNELVRKKFLQ